MIQIKLFEKQKLDDYILIEGFPGAGLVGPMANSYIIEKIRAEYIGYIDSDSFPPIAAVHDSKPMFPARVYKSVKYRLVIIISEFTIPVELIYQLGNEIIEFVRKYNIKQTISISGIPTQKPTEVAYAITTNKELFQKAQKAGINPIKEGVIAGVAAVLLSNGMQFKLDVIDLLIQVDPTIMDPKYAEIAIINLKKLIKLDINTEELEKESKILEAKVREMLKKTRDSHESYKQATEATGPSMYA